MIARCLDGHVLGSRVEFIAPASFRLMDHTRKGNPATQPSTSPVAKILASANVGKILLGRPEVEIKAVRISKGFREGLLYIKPERASLAGFVKVFTADHSTHGMPCCGPSRAAWAALVTEITA